MPGHRFELRSETSEKGMPNAGLTTLTIARPGLSNPVSSSTAEHWMSRLSLRIAACVSPAPGRKLHGADDTLSQLLV